MFYSVAWLGRFQSDNALHDGETDFIIAHPQHGMSLIEVKGGRIDHDGARPMDHHEPAWRRASHRPV